MARKTDTDAVSAASLADAPDDWEWDRVAEESPAKVEFDTIGDTFIGQYAGTQHVEQEEIDKATGERKDTSFDLFLFRGRDGKLYAINTSWKLREAMESVAKGSWVRIQYVADIPTKRGQNPMKDFTVDVRK